MAGPAPHANMAIAPKTEKPTTYKDDHLVYDAIDWLAKSRKEHDVERAMLTIIRKIFPQDASQENPQQQRWTIVPEYSVPGHKRPDILIEKYRPPGKQSANPFTPHIFIEYKRSGGVSNEKALDQVTSSMPDIIDNWGSDLGSSGGFSIFLITVRGTEIGFFEYHNDRSNLDEGAAKHHQGAIPFNSKLLTEKGEGEGKGRPVYRGSGSVTWKNADREEELGPKGVVVEMDDVYLDLFTDDVVVERVLKWMKEHNPISVT